MAAAMIRRLVKLFLPIVFLVMAAAGAAAQAEPLSFADSLFGEGDYYRAITEYKRFIHLAPGSPDAPRARLQIALAFLQGERWEEALRELGALADAHPDDDTGIRATFAIGLVHYRRGAFPEAAAACAGFLLRYPDRPEAGEAAALLGWSRLKLGDRAAAAAAFADLPGEPGLGDEGRRLAEIISRGGPSPRRSPAVAGVLSALIPGTGQLYIGRPTDALVAAVLNGLFILAAVDSFENGAEATGAVMALLGATWYLGNIQNAVGGAHKYNQAREREWIERLRVEFPLRGGLPGVAVAFSF